MKLGIIGSGMIVKDFLEDNIKNNDDYLLLL